MSGSPLDEILSETCFAGELSTAARSRIAAHAQVVDRAEEVASATRTELLDLYDSQRSAR